MQAIAGIPATRDASSGRNYKNASNRDARNAGIVRYVAGATCSRSGRNYRNASDWDARNAVLSDTKQVQHASK
jgi:hypothetical protein